MLAAAPHKPGSPGLIHAHFSPLKVMIDAALTPDQFLGNWLYQNNLHVNPEALMKNIISNTSARGFGLTETILVLALGLGIATAAFASFTPASTATQVQTATQQLDKLRNAITSAYVSSPDFSGLDTNSAVNQGWAPQISPWGSLSVNPAPVGGLALDGWEVSLSNVPADACAKLVAYEQVSGKWDELLVDGKAVSDINTACADNAQITFGKWGGMRSNAYVHPLCFDHTREWVQANGSPAPGYCPSDPAKYNPAQA